MAGRRLRSRSVELIDRIARLTPRQRDCLRLVHDGYEAKEIAPKLGISVDRVNRVISDAMQTLGVSRRRFAARILAEHEGRIAPAHSYGDQPMGVATSPNTRSDQSAEAVGELGRDDGGDKSPGRQATPAPDTYSTLFSLLPSARNGGQRNDLKTLPTLVAIAAIAALGAAIAGAAISLLVALNRLVTGS